MDWLADSWNGNRGGREVERLPPGQAVTSVIVEARWKSYRDQGRRGVRNLNSAKGQFQLPGHESFLRFVERWKKLS